MIKYIVRDLLSMLCYLPVGIAIGLLLAVVLHMVNRRRVKRCKEPFLVMAVTSFIVYAVIMLSITFLSRESGTVNGIDMQLFSTWKINDRNKALLIENILLFIPYGFTSAWAMKRARRLLPCTLLGAASSLGIECLQLITQRGYFQLDDILTNTLGAFLGCILFRIFRRSDKHA